MYIAYVNGKYIKQNQAVVSIDDRGYQFSDGIYEVVAYVQGAWVDWEPHIRRLYQSARGIDLYIPQFPSFFASIANELVRLNHLSSGIVYIQVTRGVAPRAHAFPKGVRPSIVMTTKPVVFDLSDTPRPAAAITYPDQRWGRPDLKTTALLANVLAKQAAQEAGAYEALLVKSDGQVTEGSHSNLWIVDEKGRVRTHPATHAILNGITRQTVLQLCQRERIDVVEEPFKVDDMLKAQAVFLTGTTTCVKPITQIDGRPCGASDHPLCQKIVGLYARHMRGAVST